MQGQISFRSTQRCFDVVQVISTCIIAISHHAQAASAEQGTLHIHFFFNKPSASQDRPKGPGSEIFPLSAFVSH